jgi:hypothetical protein
LDSAIVSANELRTGATRRFFLNYRGGNTSPDSRPKNTGLRIDAGESKWRKREISKEIFFGFPCETASCQTSAISAKATESVRVTSPAFPNSGFSFARDLKTKVQDGDAKMVATRLDKD